MKLIGCLVFSALVLMAGCAGDEACEVWHYDLAHQPAEEAVAEGLDAQHGLYVATLEIGTPAQEVDAIIDTGSANLVVMGPGCEGCAGVDYDPEASTTASDEGEAFQIAYGSAALSAMEMTDLVGLPCGDPIQASFGVATQVAHLPASILGLAYASLAGPSEAPLTPWFDVMVNGGVLADIFALRLCGPGRSGSHLKLGGTDESTDLTRLRYTPIVEARYYAIAPPTFALGETEVGSAASTTIIDSGTTLMLVPYEVHQALVTALKAAADAQGVSAQIPEGVWTESPSDISARAALSEAEVAAFPPLTLTLKGEATDDAFELEVTPERYLRRASSGEVYLGIRPGPEMTILGQVFMEGLDVVFDRGATRIGLATTAVCGD